MGPSYLSAETLRDAVNHLGDSDAKATIADWLVFKRALVLTRQDAPASLAVETGLENKPFQLAIAQVTGRFPPGAPVGSGQPFFSPFAYRRDGKSGFKGTSYPSNGPSDTIGRWQSRAETPLQIVPGSKPKRYEFAPRTPSTLREFFLGKSASDPPTLLDVARWWFRFTDLTTRFGHDPTKKELGDQFLVEMGLSPEEAAAVFAPLTPAEESDPAGDFQDTVADPANYLPVATAPASPAAASPTTPPVVAMDVEDRVKHVTRFVASRGFVFAPWQVAAFVTAVRTKPFVILAGISGTGKTKLPRLVAEATGAVIEVIPVHPDWTDGSELIGYERINGTFAPGRLLRLAQRAQGEPDTQFFALLDEMNIARVEYYLADVLSHIEERTREGDVLRSRPLMPHAPAADDIEWSAVCLPSNLCIVGSVNMDETTHGFSRKVLDRSFVIEFSDIDLTQFGDITETVAPVTWPVDGWEQQHLTLAAHPERGDGVVKAVIEALGTINDALKPAQLQVGYRVRDEIALFCLNARACPSGFVTASAGAVDPLDLAITMKVLPRIQGGGATIQKVLDQLLTWAKTASFPLCRERLELMNARMSTGFTSYWL